MVRRTTTFGTAATLAAALLAVAGPSDAGAQPGRLAATVLPPKRPLALRGLDVTTTGSVAAAREVAGPAQPIAPVKVEGLSEKAVVERASAALNAVRSMSADFAQIGGDGRRMSGTLYLQRPGKVRFEYNKPSTLEVVSDGSTVLVRDRKLNTADPYPISQTPLKFLLSARIDLARDTSVKSVATNPDGVGITVEDGSTLGGTSRITLSFDPELRELKRWRVVDPQGYTTTVTLSGIEQNRAIDPKVFMLNYSRPVE